MKVIKPSRLSLLSRPYEFRREFRLGVSVLAMVPLGRERALLPEVALWKMAAEQLGDSPVLDVGMPKSRAEYLIAGSAHPPQPGTRQFPVAAVLAGRRKTLQVSGDRYFVGESISQPKPVEAVPLNWAHAFGGAQYARNPLGRGLDRTRLGSAEVCWLPNIEYPHALVRSPADRPEPAGFRAIDPSWPQRSAKAGSHDERWLREDFPGFARDMDASYFNLAPEDQQLESPLPHDAAYELFNMHPTQSVLSGNLPSIRTRCFVNRHETEFGSLQEVDTRLTTVWFFPAVQRCVLIFQGSVPVTEDDASDVTHIALAAEGVEEARSLEYYREVIVRRCDRSRGHLYALKDSELCPDSLCPPDPEAVAAKAEAEGEDLARKRLLKKQDREFEKYRADVASYGLDPDLHGPVAPPPEQPPTLEELPAFLERMEAEAERQKAEQKVEAEKRDREFSALFQELGLDYDVVRKELAQKTVGPPAFSEAAMVADLESLIALFAARGLPTEHIQEIIDDPEMRHSWREGERRGREAYRASAHLQAPVPSRSAEQSADTRRQLSEAANKSYAGFDFNGSDLSGVSLSGANLEGAFLENVNFTGADLRGANLRTAVLAHSNLRDADLRGADLRGANLGTSDLQGARLDDAQLEGANLSRARLTGTRLDGAHIKQVDFTDAVFDKTSFARVTATQVTFLKSALRGVSFEGARLGGCNFLEIELAEAVFRDADVSTCVFLKVQASQADFSRATLRNARFVEGTSLAGANLSGANLREANLRGIDLQGAQLRGATLDAADLSKAKLVGADFYRASLKEARLAKADLSRANLTSANLMNAALSGARLDGANLTGSNLFGADLSRVAMDRETRLTDCLMLRTRIHPLRADNRALRG